MLYARSRYVVVAIGFVSVTRFTPQKHMDSKLDQILLLLKQHTAILGQPSSHA